MAYYNPNSSHGQGYPPPSLPGSYGLPPHNAPPPQHPQYQYQYQPQPYSVPASFSGSPAFQQHPPIPPATRPSFNGQVPVPSGSVYSNDPQNYTYHPPASAPAVPSQTSPAQNTAPPPLPTRSTTYHAYSQQHLSSATPSQSYHPPTHDQTDDLTRGLSGMNLNQRAPPPCNPQQSLYTGSGPNSALLHDLSLPERPNTMPLPVRLSGPLNEELEECEGASPISIPLYWYRLPEVPGFHICTACYKKFIQRSTLAARFERFWQSNGVETFCRFGVARITTSLWPSVLKTENMNELTAFMKRRLTIPDCKGTVDVEPKENIKWITANDISGFVSCQACYEDHIVGSPFVSHFNSSLISQPASATWACDIGLPIITRALKKSCAPQSTLSWRTFVSYASARVALPQCTWHGAPKNQNKWFEPRRTIPNMCICEACYLDYIALTDFEVHFQEANMTGNHPLATAEALLCDFVGSPMKIAYTEYLRRLDYDSFWHAAYTIMSSPSCIITPTTGASWYSLSPAVGGPINSWQVCASCYIGIMTPLGLAKCFTPVMQNDPAERVCATGPAHEKHGPLMLKLNDSVIGRSATPLIDYVTTVGSTPSCQRSQMLLNSIWYGWPDAPFCAECYYLVAKSSPLESQMELQGNLIPGETMCCLYSSRMRTLWAECCQKGSAKDFREFALKRLQVFKSVMPNIQLLEKTREAKMTSAMMSIAHGFTMSSLGAMKTMSGMGGYHGLNWETQAAGNSISLGNSGIANAVSGDEVNKIAALKMQWAEVE